jgi:thiol-disulfide isomerase/thioredoxin
MNKIRRFFAGLLVLIPVFARAQSATHNPITPHARDLVVLEGDKLVPLKSDEFSKVPYTILYFAAGWCPDCRRFSPALVEAYGRQDKGGKQFEVLLLTRDKTKDDMVRYMHNEKMKWPALAFDKAGAAADLEKYYSGHGIPCLTVIDPEGKVVLQSKSDQDANEVLKELQALLKNRT